MVGDVGVGVRDSHGLGSRWRQVWTRKASETLRFKCEHLGYEKGVGACFRHLVVLDKP